MSLGANIAALRTAKGLTQVELSEKINVHPVTLSNWERGKREPAVSDVFRLATALSCEIGDLLNPPQPSESTASKIPDVEASSE